MPGISKLVKAARCEFRAMAKAFQALRNNIAIRFSASDALALCYTLQNCTSSNRSALSATWYRRQFDAQRLEVDPSAYSPGSDGPVEFDVIDTLNLVDYLGTLNVLVAGILLLSDKPYAALLTELLIGRESSDEEAFDGPALRQHAYCGTSIRRNTRGVLH